MLAIADTPRTMSSREIAGLLDSRHDSVKRTIDRLSESGVIVRPPTVDEHREDQIGRTRVESVYMLDKRSSLIVVAQLCPEFTARIIDRWQELEAQQAPALPKTFAEALRLAAEQAERIEAQQAQLEQQAPAVAFVDRYVEARSDKGLREVAKILGIKEREFIAQLARTGVIFKQGNNWLPYAEHQKAGRFTVKTGESNGHAFIQMRFTPAGVAWVSKRFCGASLPATVPAKRCKAANDAVA